MTQKAKTAYSLETLSCENVKLDRHHIRTFEVFALLFFDLSEGFGWESKAQIDFNTDTTSLLERDPDKGGQERIVRDRINVYVVRISRP